MANLERLFREVKSTLHHCYGERLSQIVLFGSHARGDAVPGSDIDVMVVLKGTFDRKQESDKLLDALVRWNLEYQELVSVVFVPESRFLSGASPLLLNVRREGIPM
jgi:predicted nucleotidyltransferase